MRAIRLNILTPWRFFYVALTPDGRVMNKAGHWRWISVRPVPKPHNSR